MQVVQHEYKRLCPCQKLEEIAYGAVGSVALVIGGRMAAVRERGHRGEYRRELGATLVVQVSESGGRQAADVLVECVCKHPERKILLELRGGTLQHEVAEGVRPVSELGKQSCLADPGLTCDLDR